MALLEPEATPPSSDLAKPKKIAAARQCLEPLLGSEVCTHAADCGCTRADILPPIPLARAAGDLTRAARDGFLNLQPHPPAFAALAARKPPPRSARTDVGWQDVMRTGAGLCRVLATDPSALSLTYAWACIGVPDRVQIERRPTQGAEFRFACGAQGRSGGGKSSRFFGNSANR